NEAFLVVNASKRDETSGGCLRLRQSASQLNAQIFRCYENKIMRFAKTRLNAARNASAKSRLGAAPLLHLSILGGVIALAPSVADAEGFRNPPPGTFNLGRAGGRIAQVDDSSAVQQNPANLTDLTSPEVQFTPTIVYIHADYRSPGGET